jgi:hypothetical protein
MPDISNQFPQYSNVLADSCYAFDYVRRYTIGPGGNATAIFPPTGNILRFRVVTLYDVTQALGGTNPPLIACYYRIDGYAASGATANDGSSSRILKPGERVVLYRNVPQEGGITIYNPNGTAVIIQTDLGA